MIAFQASKGAVSGYIQRYSAVMAKKPFFTVRVDHL